MVGVTMTKGVDSAPWSGGQRKHNSRNSSQSKIATNTAEIALEVLRKDDEDEDYQEGVCDFARKLMCYLL